MIFSGVTALLPHIQSGRIRPIAVASPKRFSMLPDLTTFREAGIQDFEIATWAGLLAPARTSKEIISKWNTEVDRIVKSKDLRERFNADGLEPIGGSPEAFGHFIRAEIEKYHLVINRAGIERQ